MNLVRYCKYLNISFFIVPTRHFKGAEQEKVKLLLVRYIYPHCPGDSPRSPTGTGKLFHAADYPRAYDERYRDCD